MSTTTTSDVYNSTTASTGAENAADSTSSNIWTTTGVSTSNSIPCCNYSGNILLRSNFKNQEDTIGLGSLVNNNSPMMYIIFQQSTSNTAGNYFTIPVSGSIPDYQEVINYQLSQSEIGNFLKTDGSKGAIGAAASTVIDNFFLNTIGKNFYGISIKSDAKIKGFMEKH